MELLKKYRVILETEDYSTIVIGKKRNLILQEYIGSNPQTYLVNPDFLGCKQYSQEEIISEGISYVGEMGLFIPIVGKNNYIWATELVSPSINAFVCGALANKYIFVDCKERTIKFDSERRSLNATYYMGGGPYPRSHVTINIYLDELRREHLDKFLSIVEEAPLDDSRDYCKEEYYEFYLFPKSEVAIENYVKEVSYQTKNEKGGDIRTHIYIIDASIPSSHKDYFTKRFEMATLLTNGYTADTISEQGAIIEFSNFFYHFYKRREATRAIIAVQDIIEINEEIRNNKTLLNMDRKREFEIEKHRMAQKFANVYDLKVDFLEEFIYKKAVCLTMYR
ncbi:hypothetical protein [Candidatus Epulonipiscium viviparus]|uniref:hypothetical protein n=1 Tax=Candidatus Epulonipiscium viviparus TaxID=420336 RepID=UPI0027380EBC|nr:hypothetical protein [Candidatus Epulopiscium viviparus]